MYQEIRIKNREELLKREKRYLNTTGISDRTGQRMDDVRVNYRLGKTVQLDAKNDSRDFCTDVRFQPIKYLKYESDIGDMLGHRGEFSYAESHSNFVVQRKLDGKTGKLLNTIAGFIPEGTCKNLIRWLEENDEKISIDLDATMSSYDAKTKTLHFRASMFNQILQAKENGVYDESLSFFLSNICHELSHAHDFISGKEKLDRGNMSQEVCISTELRAWAREAISVLEINKAYGLAYNQSNTELIDGWVNLKIDMLDRLYQHKNNCIIDRIIRYISRCVNSESEIAIQGWMNRRRDQYVKQITSLQRSFLEKKSELYE